MKPIASCILFTTEDAWATRIRGFLSSSVAVLPVSTPTALSSELAHRGPTVVLFDLQSDGAFVHLPDILNTSSQAILVAFGLPGSDPMLSAGSLGVYSIEDRQVERQRLVALVHRAMDHADIIAENRLLRDETTRLNVLARSTARRLTTDIPTPFDARDFSRAMRHFNNVESLLQRMADEVATSTGIARAGIFCQVRDQGPYRLRASVRGLESTSKAEFAENDPLVLWLKIQAHIVSRGNLEHVTDPSTRRLLCQVLDELGAELMAPLQSRERFLGWLFVGKLTTGLPFEPAHIDNLIAITECVATTLDNALLYEEAAVQKTLAETLLHAMPSGIIAVDNSGLVRWCNHNGLSLLDATPALAMARPIEALGSSHLADIIRRTLGAAGSSLSKNWLDPHTHRSYRVETRRLENRAECLGVVAVLEDTTDKNLMKDKEDRLERATFWAELAAAMSHEVRNPLVAIKTFAQLLPERYDDAEFRSGFRDLVSQEVDRLNGIIDQINDFAHPRSMVMIPFDLGPCLNKAVATAVPNMTPDGIKVLMSVPESLPRVLGDEQALFGTFVQILNNAVEILGQRPQREITVMARPRYEDVVHPAIEILFKDNGPGIPDELLPKIFSPFCTTKTRGLGLGLPIAKRTLLDHDGLITVNSNTLGTCVSVVLPALKDP
ncbi:MAG: ATP-binding protein [bacterium]